MDGPFDPAFALGSASWTPVSPRLAQVRRLLLLLTAVPVLLGLVTVVGWLAGAVWAALAGLLALALLGWAWVAVGRTVRAWGYTERAQDLLIRQGAVFRRLVVVPYGRMQFVDVNAGPLDRAFSLATVQLHTAAASTDARIPGLPPAEAARLRDRLAARGEAQSAGL